MVAEGEGGEAVSYEGDLIHYSTGSLRVLRSKERKEDRESKEGEIA